MSWNYRLVRYPDPIHGSFYLVEEVYYDEGGKPNGRTQHGAKVGSETPEGVLEVLEVIRQDIERSPIMEYDEIKGEEKEGD